MQPLKLDLVSQSYIAWIRLYSIFQFLYINPRYGIHREGVVSEAREMESKEMGILISDMFQSFVHHFYTLVHIISRRLYNNLGLNMTPSLSEGCEDATLDIQFRP